MITSMIRTEIFLQSVLTEILNGKLNIHRIRNRASSKILSEIRTHIFTMIQVFFLHGRIVSEKTVNCITILTIPLRDRKTLTESLRISFMKKTSKKLKVQTEVHSCINMMLLAIWPRLLARTKSYSSPMIPQVCYWASMMEIQQIKSHIRMILQKNWLK